MFSGKDDEEWLYEKSKDVQNDEIDKLSNFAIFGEPSSEQKCDRNQSDQNSGKFTDKSGSPKSLSTLEFPQNKDHLTRSKKNRSSKELNCSIDVKSIEQKVSEETIREVSELSNQNLITGDGESQNEENSKGHSGCSIDTSIKDIDNVEEVIYNFLLTFHKNLNDNEVKFKCVKARGRPKNITSLSRIALEKLVKSWINSKVKTQKSIVKTPQPTKTQKGTNKARVDALFTSSVRRIRNLPFKCLKNIDRRAEFKNPNLSKFLNSYLECFGYKFVPLIKDFIDVSNTDELFVLFIHFICLSFPESKVK